MKKNIYIVSGSVQSGKTTRLFEFVKYQKSIDGILAPIVDGKRKLFHISSSEMKKLEVAISDSSTISVGKYHFLKDSFDWAKEKLLESYKKKPEWLVIDEIGKLELKNKGLHPAINKILKTELQNETKIILVIRESLLEEVLTKYKIKKNEYKLFKWN
ncbi:MAG: nucleoside-triphosphatase [Melioribacteraceae bacterium]